MILRRWIDVTDLVYYLTRHSSVSGIQRVVANCLPLLLADIAAEVVQFDPQRMTFTHLPRGEVLDLAALASGAAVGGPQPDVRRMAQQLADLASLATPIEPNPGDVLTVVGAGWTHGDFFKAVQGMKLRGAAVVVLLYDLIPVMTHGFPHDTRVEFERYAHGVIELADRVPAISHHTRADYRRFCDRWGRTPQPGRVLRLPPGLTPSSAGSPEPAGKSTDSTPLPQHGGDRLAWPRPYVLMVGTIEVRKNHLTALRAWQTLIAEHGRDMVPDLVCVGRAGWNANEFLEAVAATGGLWGRLHLLDAEVDDTRLTALYTGCLFTIYPSSYEGWGLPIAESLAFGKPVITTTATSLPEVAGDLATYVTPEDPRALADAAWTLITDPALRLSTGHAASTTFQPGTWAEVADTLVAEMRDAVGLTPHDPGLPTLTPGVEYGLARMVPYQGPTHDGLRFNEHLATDRTLPLTGQIHSADRESLALLALTCDPLRRDTHAVTLTRGAPLTFHFLLPHPGPVSLLIATATGPGEVTLRTATPTAATTHTLLPGATLAVDINPPHPDRTIHLTVHLIDATTNDEIGLRSLLITTPQSPDYAPARYQPLITTLTDRLHTATTELTTLTDRLTLSTEHTHTLHATIAEQHEHILFLTDTLHAQTTTLTTQADTLTALTTQADTLTTTLRDVLTSRSWRLTTALRGIARTLRRAVGARATERSPT